jgi:hypothetical protein
MQVAVDAELHVSHTTHCKFAPAPVLSLLPVLLLLLLLLLLLYGHTLQFMAFQCITHIKLHTALLASTLLYASMRW